MPELPDVSLYVTRLRERIVGKHLVKFRTHTPFVLRSLGKPADFDGALVTGVSRLGKRIVLQFEGDSYIVIHLMVSGRFVWTEPLPEEKPSGGKALLATWRFESGQLQLQEQSTKKRASIYLLETTAGLDEHRREGIDVLTATQPQFDQALIRESRTVKNALTDPHSFDGIGNAYSDEILFNARLSPSKMVKNLTKEERTRLRDACQSTLSGWITKLEELYPEFPKPSQITAFRKEFAVHGKCGKPCPICGAPVQHIVYADNETNYCARCQNEGKVLADRSLSRLLKGDFPRTLADEVEG